MQDPQDGMLTLFQLHLRLVERERNKNESMAIIEKTRCGFQEQLDPAVVRNQFLSQLSSVLASFSDIVFPCGGKCFLEATAVHPTSLASPLEMGCLAPITSSKSPSVV